MSECESQLVMPFPPAGSLPLNSCTTRTPFSTSFRARMQFLAYSRFNSVPVSVPYSLVNRFGLTRQVHHVGNRSLHLTGEFVAGDPSRQIGIAGKLLEVLAIEAA